jgi:hypothetical protein
MCYVGETGLAQGDFEQSRCSGDLRLEVCPCLRVFQNTPRRHRDNICHLSRAIIRRLS